MFWTIGPFRLSITLAACLAVGHVLVGCSPQPQGILIEEDGAQDNPKSDIISGSSDGSTAKPDIRCELTASPTQIAPGNQVTLTAQTFGEGFVSMAIDNKPAEFPTGFLTVSPTATTEFSAIATLKSGEIIKCNTTVTVTGNGTGGPTPTPGGNPSGDQVSLEIYGTQYQGSAVTVSGTNISCNGSGAGVCQQMIARGTNVTISFPLSLSSGGSTYQFAHILCDNQAGVQQKWFSANQSLVMDQNYRCTGWYNRI